MGAYRVSLYRVEGKRVRVWRSRIFQRALRGSEASKSLAEGRQEQEQLRLFVDANPNYNVKQDVWGALQEEKMGRRRLLNAPRAHARVKDDCIMA